MKHSFKSQITCPYCDYVDQDSWEHNFNNDDCESIECDSCGKTFTVSTHISVEYSTVGDCKANDQLPHELDDLSFTHKGKECKNYKCKKCFEEFFDHDLAEGQYPKLKADEYKILPKSDGIPY